MPSVTGIAVLDGWVYLGVLHTDQERPVWTVFPRAVAGEGERNLVDGLQAVLAALRGHRRP